MLIIKTITVLCNIQRIWRNIIEQTYQNTVNIYFIAGTDGIWYNLSIIVFYSAVL